MQRKALKQIVGLKPLPEKVLKRIKLMIFADAHHVLGQMAAALTGAHEGKINDVFDNALLRTAHDHRMLHFEMNRLERALEGTEITPILLKGAAYVARDLKAAQGRRVSDIDILVREEELDQVEKLLMQAGWKADQETDNEYDQEYYRQWMHELPPMRHGKRGTIIDVHHLLLPRTARYKIGIDQMIDGARTIEASALKTFCPADVFIHSAIHAFADGAFDNPVRGFIEHYYLFQDLNESDRKDLCVRAEQVGAEKPVGLAVWCVGFLFSDENAQKMAKNMKKPMLFWLLRWALISKAMDGLTSPLAKALLYIRSHYLRMPMRLLVPHLTRKAIQWRPMSRKPVDLPLP
ncbi:nucleotidyltransferase family protein [Kordiimonas aquimaris]|uniref:nucleotidyltransferase family protein n=1 Tax=Kordiimonas aquimaris TaxID=707591 RepID=UPI0021D0D4CA|nr:nucleotidyltransferase family protein [Kordiimonas aquimaris]